MIFGFTILFFVKRHSSRLRVEIKKGLGEVPGKHGTRVVDGFGQLAKLPFIDGPTVVRVILPEQDCIMKGTARRE